jgi:hypothetical protein
MPVSICRIGKACQLKGRKGASGEKEEKKEQMVFFIGAVVG